MYFKFRMDAAYELYKSGKIKFILLETIGHAYIDMDVSEEDMLLALKELQERYQDEY